MRYESKLNDIVQAAVTLGQVGDDVLDTLEAIDKRLRKGGVAAEVWADDTPVEYDGRAWALGYARFEGKYRLGLREVRKGREPGFSTPLRHAPRLLRLRAAVSMGALLERLEAALQDQVEETATAAESAKKALEVLPGAPGFEFNGAEEEHEDAEPDEEPEDDADE